VPTRRLALLALGCDAMGSLKDRWVPLEATPLSSLNAAGTRYVSFSEGPYDW
jgi:hypothetical protein